MNRLILISVLVLSMCIVHKLSQKIAKQEELQQSMEKFIIHVCTEEKPFHLGEEEYICIPYQYL